MLTHFILELVAAGMGAAIALIPSRLPAGSFWRPSRLTHLAVLGWWVFSVNICHAVVAITRSAADMDSFMPSSWLVGKLALPFLIFTVWRSPSQVHRFYWGTILAGGAAVAVLMPTHFHYYRDSVVGRPLDLVPVFLAVLVAVPMICDRTRAGMTCGSTLLLLIAQQVAMSISHHNYDDAFMVAHLLQVLTMVPLAVYSFAGDRMELER